MVTSIRGGKSSEARRIVKVIDSRRAVERVERALTPDRAVISNESRKRWSQQRRAMARQNRSSRRGRDFEVQKRGLRKTSALVDSYYRSPRKPSTTEVQNDEEI